MEGFCDGKDVGSTLEGLSEGDFEGMFDGNKDGLSLGK